MSMIDEYMKLQEALEYKYGKNSIVVYQVGGFYEMYSINTPHIQIGNIKKISSILNFQATRKNKSIEHSVNNPYMCGFPIHSITKHLNTLINNNYTVELYDQKDIEDCKKKSHILIGTYSPSTHIENDERDNNYLACINIECKQKEYCYAFYTCIDLSTGKNKIYDYYSKTDTKYIVNEVERLIHIINPCEIILIDRNKLLNIDQYFDKLIHIADIDRKFIDNDYQNKFLEKIFGKSDILSPIEVIGLEKNCDIVPVYIKLLQFAYEHDPYIIKKIYKPEMVTENNDLYLNNDAVFNLNLIDNNNNNSKFSSLFNVINNTNTKMGMRALKDRLLRPIRDINELNARYDKIDKIKDKYKDYKKYLVNILDIEKKYRKLVLQKLHPHELGNLNKTFQNIISVLKIGENDFQIETQIIQDFEIFYEEYLKTFNITELEKYDLMNIKSSFFNPGIDNDIDSLYSKITLIEKIFDKISDWLSSQETANKARVKVCNTDKDGYYLSTTVKKWNELSKLQGKMLFDYDSKKIKLKIEDLTCLESNKSGVKIRSKLLSTLSSKMLKYQHNIKILVKKKYLSKLAKFNEVYGKCILDVSSIISEIDITVSNAETATKYAYHKPVISQSSNSFVDYKDIRHPIIERIQTDKEYITNDITINKNGVLLYGLNSSGKSSLLRAIGLNIIMAQCGMYVSCKDMKYYPFKNVMTKISSNDNLFKGQSTFIVEMLELKEILLKSDEYSMILCDELTAGTETNSATGIVASSIMCLIKKQTNFMFTTHLHGLMEFEEIINQKQLDIFHFKIKIDYDNVEYERKLIKGSGNSRYGIEIANAMGLDKSFIKQAYKFRNMFENKDQEFLKNKRSRYNSSKIIDNCEKCGDNTNLHTHHIQHQSKSDKDGIISDKFHKNTKFNLMTLCEKCHIEIHK